MALRGVQVRVRIRVRVWDSRGELFSEGSDFQIKFGDWVRPRSCGCAGHPIAFVFCVSESVREPYQRAVPVV